MRVLIHTDEYSPTAQACTNRMRSFSDALMAAGADVTVICSKGNLENGTPRLGPEKVIYAPAFRMRKKTAARRLLNNITFGISSFLCALGVGKIDAVITTSPPPLVSLSGWLITKVKKSKLIYDVRDIWPDVALEMGSFSETSIYCRMFRKVTAFMYQHADLITTVSPGKLEKIKNYCHLEENCGDRLLLISNGFDENVSKSPIDERIAEKFDLRKAPCCVYIGNIGLAQGLDALLRLAAETSHREVRFLLFGKGAEKEKLECLAKEMGLNNVLFCGPLPFDQVHTVLHYAAVSFISLKSSRMQDSIPTKLYEALGIGCPVLLM
ncbi:MAG: glycosyltransferase family 4 protein, partial [Clostridia bacterium]|nr:glycosyltransferase family 4 protein [Clostridia bacterium]